MSIGLVDTLKYRSRSGVEGRYALLNRGAPNTILFCPGASGNCYMLSWFQNYAKLHPNVAFLTIDRWPRPDPSIKDASLLEHLTQYTIDLLDSIDIEKITIVSHSAGVYQQLHLAQTNPGRVKAVVLLATHIPAAFLHSRTANLLLQVPDAVFGLIKTIDSKGVSWLNRLGLRQSIRNPDQFYKLHLGDAVTDTAMDQLILNTSKGKSTTDARDIDYALTWQRINGIDGEALKELYTQCKIPVTWFTSPADIYFGPEAVERIRIHMHQTEVTVRIIEKASHANIYRRKDVWDEILQKAIIEA